MVTTTSTVVETITVEIWRHDTNPPEIGEFNWSARVVNDKIYDIFINFKIRDDKTKISYAEVRFIPERYYHFVTKYGMRPEDYDKVFP
ncbi:hypothetical protein, partial [Pyrobaculum aerophilum]|uniref:hypothetical protein n=1 Tax=Pyrobaculum aerophilum TaxID=13773 RepID=UPI001C6E7D8F